MNRALFSKMTVTRFSPVFSGCLVTLLIWGCSTGICMVKGETTVEPVSTTATANTTMTGYNATEEVEVFGNQLHIPCENSSLCYVFCDFCEKIGQPTMDCLSNLFNNHCLGEFNNQMATLNRTDWCVWDKVGSFYSTLSLCTEDVSDCLLVPWPNELVEKLFVNVHSEFFKACPTEEFSDPPPAIVFALVITPICLIPVMVSLVVLKTKNGDGTS